MSCYFLYLVALDIIMQVEKILGSRGKALVARRSGRNTPSSQSAIRRWRNARPTAMALAAAPVGADGGGHLLMTVPFNLSNPAIPGTVPQIKGRRPPSADVMGTAALRLTPQGLRHLRMAL